MKRCLTIAGFLAISPATYGGSVLLGTWSIGSSFSTPQIATAARPVLMYFGPNNEFLSPLFEQLPLPVVFPTMVMEKVTGIDDTDFNAFVSRLTDGEDDALHVLAWSPDGPIGGGGGLESEIDFLVPSAGPDLIGYRVDSIREVLEVDLQSPGADPLGTGINTDWSVSGFYEFYGTPIPEPGTFALCILAAIGLSARRRCGLADGSSRRPNCICVGLAVSVVLPITAATSYGQCVTGGADNLVNGLNGSDTNQHDFVNQCFAALGTNVTITIQAMADLGCNSADATKNPPIGGQCPTACSPIPCCDTAPENKYVTATANGHALNPSVSGSSNMPSNGRFFADWNGDCYTSAQACLEAGRSPCDPETPGANRRNVTIPSATWNSWLGANGSTMTISVTSSASVTSAPNAVNSLALYCQNLGFNIQGCGTGACSGLCGPLTYTQVSVSYSAAPTCVPAQCPQGNICQYGDCVGGSCVLLNRPNGTTCTSDGNPCTNDTCNGSGTCTHPNNSNPCNDGLFCNGTDTCSGGSCSTHSGDPCPGEYCDESADVCRRIIVSSNPPDCAIDARKPSDPDGSPLYGWQSAVLTMSGSASGIVAGNFSVTSTSGTAPSVSNVSISSTDVTVNLSGRIPPGAWTTITYNPGLSSVCLGYLPADANNDATSAPVDILDLVDNLNGVYSPPMQIWQCDPDRSALCAPADILELIDLLNGAGAYDVWNGVSIGTAPCACQMLMAGGSSGEEFDSRFADSFVAYLATSAPTDSEAKAEFVAVVEGLTAWCLTECNFEVREAIVKLLEDESLAYHNDVGRELVPRIVALLLSGSPDE